MSPGVCGTDDVSMMTTNRPDPFSGRTLFKIGIGLVLVAAALFLRHSIDQGWIGPLARVVLAAIAGGGMIVIGLAVEERRPLYGRLLQGAGGGVLFLTTYAAHSVVGLTGSTEAFLQFVAVAGLMVGLAVRAGSEALAALGLGAAAAAPVVFGGRMPLGGEVGYLVVVAAAATVLAWTLGWTRAHVITALGLSASVALDVLGETSRVADVHLQAAVTLSWSMLVVMPLVRAIVDRSESLLAVVGSAAGSIAFHLSTRLIWGDDRDVRWVALALGLAAGHAAVARLLAHVDLRRLAAVQAIPVVGLSLAAMAESLPLEWLLVGGAATAVGLVVFGRRETPAALDAGHLVFLATAVAMIGFVSEATERSILDLVPGAFVLVSAALIGLLLGGTGSSDIRGLYLAAAHGGGVAWMLVEFPRLGAEGLAWVTAGWTVAGIFAVAVGRIVRSRTVFGVGLATIALAVGKLLLVDLATASPITRIGLFAGVGVLLLATGYWLGDSDVSGGDDAVATTSDEESEVPGATRADETSGSR